MRDDTSWPKGNDIETAYRIVTDINESAESLLQQKIFHPFKIEVTWLNWKEDYEVCIDVSIKPKVKKI